MKNSIVDYSLVTILLLYSLALQAGNDPVSPAADSVASRSLQADSDKDGVPDIHDLCPDTPAVTKVKPTLRIALVFDKQQLMDERVAVPVDSTGCAKDGDGDGVADYRDFCPEDTLHEISSGVGPNGCPLQSDGDGTPDYRDACPGTPLGVATDPSGCPV